MPPATRHAMPAADAAWLHMDRPTNPMVVNALLLLDAVPPREIVLGLLERRLVDRYPRFRRRVVEPYGRPPAFEDDPAFDLEAHVHWLTMPSPGDRGALEELVGELITSPLESGRPLWDAYVIDGAEDGSAAVLWRIHHCIADGIALSGVLFAISDEGAEGAAEHDAAAAPNGDGGAEGSLRSLAGVPAKLASTALGAGEAVAHQGMETLVHPRRVADLAGTALRDVGTAAKLIGAPGDEPSRLRARLSGVRRVAWSDPFPLERIRGAARRRRVTINDLLVAALAASLHEELGDGDALPEEIHALIPFNLRSLEEGVAEDLGNDFALILLELPVGEVGAAERLREVSSRMDAIKRSHEAPIAYGLIGAIGLTPPWAEDRLIGFFTDKASLVVTNVPGPRERVRFADIPIAGVLVWAPCSGSLGMTVSIFSYGGEVTVGFMADVALFPDPSPLARAYERELHRLGG